MAKKKERKFQSTLLNDKLLKVVNACTLGILEDVKVKVREHMETSPQFKMNGYHVVELTKIKTPQHLMSFVYNYILSSEGMKKI